jgi:hypothetical protein
MHMSRSAVQSRPAQTLGMLKGAGQSRPTPTLGKITRAALAPGVRGPATCTRGGCSRSATMAAQLKRERASVESGLESGPRTVSSYFDESGHSKESTAMRAFEREQSKASNRMHRERESIKKLVLSQKRASKASTEREHSKASNEMGEGQRSDARAQTRAPQACMGGGREGDGGSDDLQL